MEYLKNYLGDFLLFDDWIWDRSRMGFELVLSEWGYLVPKGVSCSDEKRSWKKLVDPEFTIDPILNRGENGIGYFTT